MDSALLKSHIFQVYEIYWSCTKHEAVETLQRLHRYSLVQCKRDDESGCNFFSVPDIQLDLLRTTVPIRRQQVSFVVIAELT